MTNENIKKDKKDKKIKILNQGTYGCIFKPGLTCEGMVDNSSIAPNYLGKLFA